ANGLVSNFTTVPIGISGQACTNDAPGVPSAILSRALAGESLRMGAIALGPVRILEGAGFPFLNNLAGNLSRLLRKPVSEEDVQRLIAAYRAKKRLTARKILARYGVDRRHVDPRLVQIMRAASTLDEQGVAVGFGTLRNLGTAFGVHFAAGFT